MVAAAIVVLIACLLALRSRSVATGGARRQDFNHVPGVQALVLSAEMAQHEEAMIEVTVP
jgi:hypothetical protein